MEGEDGQGDEGAGKIVIVVVVGKEVQVERVRENEGQMSKLAH
jgi:hypothetical protein